ncbi:ribosomal protein S6 kinase-like 1 isoform X2 [Conger conger]|uniref:ribosomal protein S6 kinase-like 1 isoform X2 n=1 Tax=Conger conger TaxID=82655 RepID=UPI002A5AF84D|nr:ribosomal protein S6 kinase-like 1 isoform X2 [Conger conger]
MAKRDYLVDAARQIRMALDREVNEDYEAAFNYYKNGVDLLLNGVQDPNKERREAVKRKTTQYLKRAEEIFNSHLQGTLGSGTSLSGGYSSLRFRPIRNLSSPVEDLKMCKVIGVLDKVLTVQNLISKETFVVKSLPKSSWESRDQPTIIPQGVPFMVKLLRYYVSEDAVYLHLEHIEGGRLFSKLHKSRSDKVKEHPECCSPNQSKIRLKTSYTAPTISLDYQQGHTGGRASAPLSEEGERWQDRVESPDTDSPASWDEARRRLESCRTHSYCEETGCLYSARAGPRHLDSEPTQQPGELGSDNPSLNTNPLSESQENPPLPPQCCYTRDARETPQCARTVPAQEAKKAESGLDFDIAWKWNSADPPRDCGGVTTDLSSDLSSGIVGVNRVPQMTQSFAADRGTEKDTNQGVTLHSEKSCTAPTSLRLPFSNHIQDMGADAEKCSDCSVKEHVGSTTGLVLTMHKIREGGEAAEGKPAEKAGLDAVATAERSQSVAALATSTGPTESATPSGNSRSRAVPLCHPAELQQGTPAGTSPDATGVLKVPASRNRRSEEEGWEVLSPLGRDASQSGQKRESQGAPYTATSVAASLQGEMVTPDGPAVDQPIEVDGWCLLPRFSAKRPTGRARLGCWGLPEGQVRLWGAEILLSLESLHQQGILCRDLNPKNILLDSNGKACLTYFGQWTEVQTEISTKAMEQMYCAPEVGGVSELTEACDWWSLGALLFELLTGMPLRQCHPAGVLPHTQLLIPDDLSAASASLLTEVSVAPSAGLNAVSESALFTWKPTRDQPLHFCSSMPAIAWVPGEAA